MLRKLQQESCIILLQLKQAAINIVSRKAVQRFKITNVVLACAVALVWLQMLLFALGLVISIFAYRFPALTN